MAARSFHIIQLLHAVSIICLCFNFKIGMFCATILWICPMKKKSLYITDLDGTLLQNDGTLSAFSKSGLKQMLDHRLPITIASARSIASMKPILDGLTFHLPVISFNGGLYLT